MKARNRGAAFVFAFIASVTLGCGHTYDGGGASEGAPSPPGQGPAGGSSAPSCASELHIFGVYETHSEHSFNNHPPGAAAIHIERQGAMVLALSSYEPVHWTVTAAPGATIEKVILNGYHDQTADVPSGVAVEIHAGPSESLGAYAYAWPSAEGGSDTSALVSAFENASGRKMTSFHGCYQSPSFTLHADLSVTAACAESAGYFLTGHVDDSACEPPPPADGCPSTSEPGKYVGWYCDLGYAMIITEDIGCEEALANCELNASGNPDMSFYCTWNDQLIHESEVSPGACDWLSSP